jgi:hypothetical protein
MQLWLITAGVAFFASVVSGVAGFGGAAVLLPVVVYAYGARASVPVVTLAVMLGNAARVWFYRRHLDWRVIRWFCGASVPLALVGSVVYVSLPAFWIKKAIGAFLIFSVVYQEVRRPVVLRDVRFFAPLGAFSGFVSAIIGAIGPVAAPFFLSYGLVKEAYVGSEAFCAMATHLAKSVAYARLSVLGPTELRLGVSFGLVMTGGSYAAKLILERMPREKFLLLVKTLLVVVGLSMLVRP